MTVVVSGLAELSAAFQKAEREARLAFRAGLREAVEPVRRDAEVSAQQSIRHMPASPRWARMRTGQSRSVVYVAPRQRGVKTTGRASLRRPNLADLLMDRAMEPALERHTHEIEQRLDGFLDGVVADFNRGG